MSVEIYNKLLKAHGVRGNPEEAHALLQSMMQDLVVTPKSWVHAMHAYDKSRMTTTVKEWHGECDVGRFDARENEKRARSLESFSLFTV